MLNSSVLSLSVKRANEGAVLTCSCKLCTDIVLTTCERWSCCRLATDPFSHALQRRRPVRAVAPYPPLSGIRSRCSSPAATGSCTRWRTATMHRLATLVEMNKTGNTGAISKLPEGRVKAKVQRSILSTGEVLVSL